MGWIIGFYAAETDGNGAIAGVWDGDEVALLTDAADLPSLLNSAEFTAAASGATIETMRAAEGDFQARFTDYDVRLLPANQTITLA